MQCVSPPTHSPHPSCARSRYVDDDGDTITVCSEAEWKEALNFTVGGIMYVRCELKEVRQARSFPRASS
eukprot:COSAG02_NODE_60618_length_270_cov_4608.754386_1_plen_68_part_10